MRKQHLLSLSAVLIAGLAFGSVNTASAGINRGANPDKKVEITQVRHGNDRHDNNSRYDRNDRNDRSRDDGRNDRGRDYGRNDRYDNNRHSNNNNKTVIIKKESNRWNVGDALLFHFGRTVIDEVFDTHPRQTTVIVRQGYYQTIWVEPVYEYRRTPCGDLVKVVVREGFYKKVWIPATTTCETGYH
jgi:hypothetical protein